MGTGRLGVALVGLSALGAAACAGILGIDDRQLDTQLEGGSSSGGGGDGGGGDDGGSCADPCPMAMGLNHPFEMVADESNVYWTEFGDDENATNGSVKSCPTTGCGAGPLVYAVLQANPRGIAVDANNVYWGTALSQSVNGAIWSCPIAGCPGSGPKKVVTANVPYQVSVDALYVYWADNFDDSVNRALKGGGPLIVLNDGGGNNALTNGQGCVVDATSIYVTDYDYDLYRLPLAGGSLVPMYGQTMGNIGPAAVTLDATHVYLGVEGSILQEPKTATSAGAAQAIVNNVPDPDGLQVDPSSGDLYWSDWGSGTGTDGTVGKVPTNGGTATVMHQSLVTPEAIAVNGTYVFWLSNGTVPAGSMSGATTSGTGMLYRSAK